MYLDTRLSDSGLPDSRTPGLPDSRTLGLLDSWTPVDWLLPPHRREHMIADRAVVAGDGPRQHLGRPRRFVFALVLGGSQIVPRRPVGGRRFRENSRHPVLSAVFVDVEV